MRIFLKESVPAGVSGLREPMLDENEEAQVKEERQINGEAEKSNGIFKRLPSVRNAISLVKRRHVT